MLNFVPNMIIPVLTGEKLFKYWRKNIPVTYLSKMGYLLAKNLLLVSDKLQIRHTSKLPYAEKKPQNNFFIRGQEHCENGMWNIQIFFTFFHNLKIFDVRFEASVQLVPTISFTSCLQSAWTAIDFFVNLADAVDCVQLVPKYYSKVNLRSWQSPTIFVWNN